MEAVQPNPVRRQDYGWLKISVENSLNQSSNMTNEGLRQTSECPLR